MPKDRKKTYSDHQAQAARMKKLPSKKKATDGDVNPAVKAVAENK